MKTKLILFLVISFYYLANIPISYSQYIPTLNNNAEWNTYSFEEAFTNRTYQITGDSIIDEIVYKKVLFYETNYGINNWYDSVLLREDTVNKKIYQRANSFDFVLYDFSLNVGDTFHFNHPQSPNYYPNLILDSITDTVYVNSEKFLEANIDPLRVFYFHSSFEPSESYVWIEGIGSLVGILYSYKPWYEGLWFDETLLCHYNENGDRDFHFIYSEEQQECLGYVGINENKKISEIHIYPNPIKGSEVFIEGKEISSVQIFDSKGSLIVSYNNADNFKKINIPDKLIGLFFIKIIMPDNQYVTKKIVKK